jgi:hypothetical protein
MEVIPKCGSTFRALAESVAAAAASATATAAAAGHVHFKYELHVAPQIRSRTQVHATFCGAKRSTRAFTYHSYHAAWFVC